KALSVIARAADFADEQQKKQLLSDSFTKEIIQKAIDEAAQYDSNGRWLDTYTDYYMWLQAIDPNNEEYSSYADRLLEKANIATSFHDSPCETRRKRFEKVEKQMFVRAVDVLNFNYVGIVDYGQMATKAIRRCRLLAEVISSSSDVRDGLGLKPDAGYDKKLAAWSAALVALSDEVKQSPIGISKDKFIDIFEKVLALNSAILELPGRMLISQFAEAALSALDPYTDMVWPTQVEDFERTVTNEFTGIGVEISKQKGLLTVVSLLPDTPAYNSGLDAGDVIEAVDGTPTKDMTLLCAVHRITGPAGEKVTLTIRHAGEDKTEDITIIRAKIIVPTIRGWQRTETGKWLYMVDDQRKIGYVRITSFSESTGSDLEKVLGQLEAEGMKGLILDLRSNSGGLLSSAIEVTDKFVEKGVIVSTRPRFIWTSAPAHKKNTHPNYPLVVLVNRYSASASEIVAGALQDEEHKRAILVGERTQGKGSVQGITSYPEGGAQLKYTMAYYHLPSGQRVKSPDEVKKQDRKDWGVGPNIEMEFRSDEFFKMRGVQRDNSILVKAGHHNSGATEVKKHTLQKTIEADAQLAVGILVVRSKLIQEQVKSVKPVAVNN
ncbi:MAG: S41 family peptidase, partial [Planctomycetota bacterium]